MFNQDILANFNFSFEQLTKKEDFIKYFSKKNEIFKLLILVIQESNTHHQNLEDENHQLNNEIYHFKKKKNHK